MSSNGMHAAAAANSGSHAKLDDELLRVSSSGSAVGLLEHLHKLESELKSSADAASSSATWPALSGDTVRSVVIRTPSEQVVTRLARIQVALLDRDKAGAHRNAAFEFLLSTNEQLGAAGATSTEKHVGALLFAAQLFEALGRRVQNVRNLVPETLTLTLRLLGKSAPPATRCALLQLLRALLLACQPKKMDDAKRKAAIVKLLRAELGADESAANGSPLEKAHALRVLLPYVAAARQVHHQGPRRARPADAAQGRARVRQAQPLGRQRARRRRRRVRPWPARGAARLSQPALHQVRRA
jgi:hypothetical protein